MTVPQWISVNDRLPDVPFVLAFDCRGRYWLAIHEIDGVWIDDSDSEVISGITHWMELPEPPKEEA